MFKACLKAAHVGCRSTATLSSTFKARSWEERVQLYVLRLPSSEAWEHVWILPKQISEHLDSLPICRRLTMIWVRETHLSLGSSSATNRAAHWHALHWGYFRQSSHFGALITGLKALCEPKHAVGAFNDGGRSQSTQTPRRHPWKVFIRESTRKRSAPITLPSMLLFRTWHETVNTWCLKSSKVHVGYLVWLASWHLGSNLIMPSVNMMSPDVPCRYAKALRTCSVRKNVCQEWNNKNLGPRRYLTCYK